MSQLKRIGILGGMGPEATILLQQKLLAAVQVTDDSGHIPLFVDMNPQVPSRIEHLVHGHGQSPAPVLAAMAKGLQNAGAKALAMPCNTAHHYAGAISAAVSVPLLNMIDISVDQMASIAPAGARIGMLASPALQKTQLFEQALAARGLTTVWPENSSIMLAAIQEIKQNSGNPAAKETLNKASAWLVHQDVQFQFIACSEFSLIRSCITSGAQILDTLDILAGAITAFSASTTFSLEQT